jgi:hypothetical protein
MIRSPERAASPPPANVRQAHFVTKRTTRSLDSDRLR